jgi:uncharacterized damage-inducible protein DinB
MRVLVILLSLAGLHAQNLLPHEDALKEWQISKQFTVEVAKAMPAGEYSFRPMLAQMSFGEQMLHIAVSLQYRFAEIRGEKPDLQLLARLQKLQTKDEIVGALAEGYDAAIATLRSITPEQLRTRFKVDWKGRPETDGANMIVNMFVHAAHHRAQCEVYLRLKGFTPPQYTF